jgi:uncharacterized protein (DUF2147 family)
MSTSGSLRGILDPNSGDVYECKVKATGDRLEVRGFIGIAAFGRSQTWKRFR